MTFFVFIWVIVDTFHCLRQTSNAIDSGLQMLRFILLDALPDASESKYLFEEGRVLAVVGKHPKAEQNLSSWVWPLP